MNFFETLFMIVKTKGNEVAILDDSRSITYKQLYHLILVNKKRLLEANICEKAVVLKTSEQLKFGISFLSLLAAGYWVVPILPDTPEYIIKKLSNIYKINFQIQTDFFDYDSIIKEEEEISIDEEQCGIYHLTSGSTGEPKLCIRSLRRLKEEGIAYSNIIFQKNKKVLSMAPIQHSFALGIFMGALLSASSTYVINRFVPRRSIEIMATWKCNIIVAVPIMIKTITYTKIQKQYDFTELVIGIVGTGIVPSEVRTAFKEKFGIFISSNYGSTETGGLLMRLTETPADSIGQEMGRVQIKIIKQNGETAKVGEEGEAYVKCNYMMSGYLNGNGLEFDSDGYLPMGDILTKDKRGFYYIVGRSKNIINIGGKKVNPKQVEDILLKCTGIRECHVMKANKPNGDEIVKAIIVCELQKEEYVRNHLKRYLPDYMVPAIIEFTERIERNMLGKITIQKGDD